MSKQAFKKRLAELGYTLSEEDIDQAFISYKQLKYGVVVEPLTGEKCWVTSVRFAMSGLVIGFIVVRGNTQATG